MKSDELLRHMTSMREKLSDRAPCCISNETLVLQSCMRDLAMEAGVADSITFMDKMPDIHDQMVTTVAKQFARNENNVFCKALEKRFGNASEDSARQCSIAIVGGVIRLMHGGDVLCEIHPIESVHLLPGTQPQNKITYTQKYRIF